MKKGNGTPGRNDPCPCGSGVKYKKCCLHGPRSSSEATSPIGTGLPVGQTEYVSEGTVSYESLEFKPNPDISENIGSQLQKALSSQHFESGEQAQAFAEQFIESQNNRGLDEFHGLSPAQMQSMLTAPMQSIPFMDLPENFSVDIDIPFVLFFDQLLMAVGNGAFKPTATGNLPRNFCRRVGLLHWGEEQYAEKTRYSNINSELDYPELNCFRHTCELAGYLKKYRGKYIIGNECKRLMKSGGFSAVYRGLFDVFNNKFNWAFADQHPDLHIVQNSWAFSLFLLQKHGADWKPTGFYEDAFLNAFPALIDSVENRTYSSPENTIKSCYRLRVIRHWMSWFGLAQIEDRGAAKPYEKNLYIRKTELADEVVIFKC